MRAVQQLLCLLHGGHKPETTEDAFGGTTVCARCGKVQHRPWAGEKPAEGDSTLNMYDTGGGN